MKKKLLFFTVPASLLIISVIAGCVGEGTAMDTKDGTTAQATFAGGCFWCLEHAFEGRDGVIDAISGYAGGGETDATYEKVCSGRTGHTRRSRLCMIPPG